MIENGEKQPFCESDSEAEESLEKIKQKAKKKIKVCLRLCLSLYSLYKYNTRFNYLIFHDISRQWGGGSFSAPALFQRTIIEYLAAT